MDNCISISPCPNDTFAICGMHEGYLPTRQKWSFEFHDIETLNQLALNQNSGIFKISAGTYPKLKGYQLLPCGMAATTTAGPLIVASARSLERDPQEWTLAIPGKGTTAAFLASFLAPPPKKIVEYRYHEIAQAIYEQKVDAGILIHESRFTYPQLGLKLAYDLGQLWHEATHSPLILSCMVASDDIPEAIQKAFVLDYRMSLDWAYNHQAAAWPFIETLAQEKDPSVIQAHIDHFVGKITHTAPTEILNLMETLYAKTPSDFCDHP